VAFGARQRKKIMDLAGWASMRRARWSNWARRLAHAGTRLPGHSHGSVPCQAVRKPQPAILAAKMMAQADQSWWPWSHRIAPTADGDQAAAARLGPDGASSSHGPGRAPRLVP
jgi:hypothetical protein